MARKEDIVIRRRKKVAPGEQPKRRQTEPAPRGSSSERRRQKNRRRFWVRLAALVLAVMLGFVVWFNWEVLNPEYVWTWAKLQVTGGDTGDGFPQDIEGNTVVDMDTVGHQLCVLTDGYLLMYNSTAGETVRRSCAFAKPALYTAGKYALIAEIGGKRLRLETLSKSNLEVQTDAAIVAASVADNGSFAVVVESTSYQSEVWVYNASGKKKYHWSSASMLVMDVALKDNTMAVIGTSAANGALQSELLVMDITTEDDPVRTALGDSLLYDVHIFSNGHIAAVGDAGSLVYASSKKIQTIDYEDRRLLGYAYSGNRLGLMLGSYGSKAGGELLAYDSNGKAVNTTAFTGEDRWLDGDDNGGFLLLTSEGLSHVSSSGKTTHKGTFGDGIRVTAFDRQAIVLGLTQMEAISY